MFLTIGVSNHPNRRRLVLNSGIPPAAPGKWIIKMTSQALPDIKTAEEVEQQFKVRKKG